MNPLNHALNTSSVSYLSVYLSTQMYVQILFPFRQALSITMCARGWGLLMDFSTACELLSQKCNPMATFFLLIILTDLAWNIGFPQQVQKIMSVGCEWQILINFVFFCFATILIDGSEKRNLWLNFFLFSSHVFEQCSKQKVDTSYCLLAL